VRARTGTLLVRSVVGTALLLAGCTPIDDTAAPTVDAADTADEPERPADRDAPDIPVEPGEPRAFPPAPAVPDGPLDHDLASHVDDLVAVVASDPNGRPDAATIDAIIAGSDARVGWILSDVLRFSLPDSEAFVGAVRAFEELTGVELTAEAGGARWVEMTDHLLAWDLPAWPDYREAKAQIYLATEPGWRPFFDDPDADIDWRLISWGGVLIDDRPPGYGAPCPAGCIPALDRPSLTPAVSGAWYPDDRIVFGIVVDGHALALPRHQMEIHEMVNTTFRGRHLGIPYCTLCGAAQAYFTDNLPDGFDRAVLRTSGLLSRSNKVMYDLETKSAFDTFTGRAISGPLREAGVTLEQVTVVASTWGEWRRAHPDTRIVAQDGGIGWVYDDDPLRGRDDHGPIFPVGNIDPRLPAQELVVGAIAPDGTPVAFPVVAARAVLGHDGEVGHRGLVAHLDGDGLRLTAEGRELAAHQAYWFAWSQFHPATELWIPESPTG
jgi:hypothetical protein